MEEQLYQVVYPDENKTWKYAVQAHVRGASVHLDVRLEIDSKTLVGWTLDTIKSILAELILKHSNEEEFKQALKKDILKGRSWKEYLGEVINDPSMKLKDELSSALDDKYKESISLKTNEMSYEEIASIIEPYKERVKKFLSDPNNKILSQPKLPEPHEWLNAKGKVPPGEVGATRNLAGFFVPFDSGTVEFGAQKEYMHEYWLWGKVFNGKFIWRRLARTKKFQKTGRKLQVWMMWRTKDEDLPYVLKKRAVDQGWMPPEGVSALPKFIRQQIPKGYEYWKKKGAAAKKLRDELVKAIKKKEVSLHTIKEALESRKTKFQFKRLWWRGPVVVRGQPQIFYVLILHDGSIHKAWHFSVNILKMLEEASVDGESLDMEEFFREYCPLAVERILESVQCVEIPEEHVKDNALLKDSGSLPPEHPLNPNKELDLNFDTLDKGAALIIGEEKDQFYRIEFQGKLLKGLYVLFRQAPGSVMWKMDRAELPHPKERIESEEMEKHFVGKSQFVLHKHYGEGIKTHWDIRILAEGRLLEFNIYKNPMEMDKNEEALAGRKYCEDLSWFIVEGQGIEKIVNDLVTKIDVLDRGSAEVLSNDDLQATFILEGGHFQGHYQWSKHSGTIKRLSTSVEEVQDKVKERQVYAPVPPSGKVLGPIIQPGQVADSFKHPIVLQDNFIFIANPDRETKGDIDIFIRAPMAVLKDEDFNRMTREELIATIQYYKSQLKLFDDWYNRALHFRLYRAVKAQHPDLLKRLHISNDMRGPFTSYLPVYNLVLVPAEQSIIRMSREQVESSIMEAFRWAKKYEIDQELTRTRDGLWIRGQALFPVCSLNRRCYSREEIKKMARTAIGKPIMVNHGDPPYEGLIIGRIEDAEEEGGKLEFIGVITDKEWIKRIEAMNPEERKLSIAANPREVIRKRGREYPVGLVIDEISIIVPPAEPGVPKAHFEVLKNGWH